MVDAACQPQCQMCQSVKVSLQFWSLFLVLCIWQRVALQLSDKMLSIFCQAFDLFEFRVLQICYMCHVGGWWHSISILANCHPGQPVRLT